MRLPKRLALAAAVIGVTACGPTLPTTALPSPSPPPAAGPAPSVPPCDPTASYRPQGPLPAPGAMPIGTLMRTIQDRGRLVVAVPRDVLGLGFLDPSTNTLKGLEPDMVRQVAKAIFGADDQHVDHYIEFRLITQDKRFTAPANGTVDLSSYGATVTCDRWQIAAFSTVYYDAGVRLLVPKESTAGSIMDLGGKRVCTVGGATSAARIQSLPVKPHAIAVITDDPTDCLALLQEGKTDSILFDDTVLAGFATQDPYVKVIGQKIQDEPYGMAMSLDHPEFVRFVNAVLEQVRANGTWTAIYNRSLSALGPAPAPPAAHYRD